MIRHQRRKSLTAGFVGFRVAIAAGRGAGFRRFRLSDLAVSVLARRSFAVLSDMPRDSFCHGFGS